MKLVSFDYVNSFRCLAGACPDTCCKDWQIIPDAQAVRSYRAVGGPLGEKLRGALVEEDGQTVFRLQNGRCALLREDGLCPIQAELGEDALCRVCFTHPRFIEEYGATQELTLSLSCPAAASLLLRRETPLQLVTTVTGGQVASPNDLDAALYLALQEAREAAFRIAQCRSLSMQSRLALELLLAAQVQALLDEKKDGAVSALCRRFFRPVCMKRQLARAGRCRMRRAELHPCWMLLNNMEHLAERFTRLLDTAISVADGADLLTAYPTQAENLLVYFLFRYYLKAVNDRQLLPRVQSCVFHVIAIRELFRADGKNSLDGLCSLAALYSKEVEHSEENLLLLQRAFSRGTLHSAYLLSLLF